MHQDHNIFIEAIKYKKKVSITTRENSGSKRYRPLFYIPASGQEECAHYYVWDGEKGEKGDIYWLTPEQIVSIEPTQEHFESAGITLVSNEDGSDSSDLLEHT